MPEVHHVAGDYFVMSYLGSNDLARALREQGSGAYGLWMAAMEHLLLVHARGQYLSQCFARNIIVSDDFRGMIDFEDDPLEVMTLEQAQARDWLIFLQSSPVQPGAGAGSGSTRRCAQVLGRESAAGARGAGAMPRAAFPGCAICRPIARSGARTSSACRPWARRCTATTRTNRNPP